MGNHRPFDKASSLYVLFDHYGTRPLIFSVLFKLADLMQEEQKVLGALER